MARLMRVMGLEAVYPKTRLSQPGEGHIIYPHRLQQVPIERVNQVVEHGHHLHSPGAEVRLPGGRPELGQAVRAERALSPTLKVDFCKKP
jgi:hypothetical protein